MEVYGIKFNNRNSDFFGDSVASALGEIGISFKFNQTIFFDGNLGGFLQTLYERIDALENKVAALKIDDSMTKDPEPSKFAEGEVVMILAYEAPLQLRKDSGRYAQISKVVCNHFGKGKHGYDVDNQILPEVWIRKLNETERP